MELPRQIANLNRECIFVEADTGEAPAVASGDFKLQKTFGNCGFGLNQRFAQVIRAAAHPDVGQIGAKSAAPPPYRMAARAPAFAGVKLSPACRIAMEFLWRLASQGANEGNHLPDLTRCEPMSRH